MNAMAVALAKHIAQLSDTAVHGFSEPEPAYAKPGHAFEGRAHYVAWWDPRRDGDPAEGAAKRGERYPGTEGES